MSDFIFHILELSFTVMQLTVTLSYCYFDPLNICLTDDIILPALPFGRRTARRSQVGPQGTDQLTQKERRTQTLKTEKPQEQSH